MNKAIIGTTDYIYLTDVSNDPIPAKIDTGADASAVWASVISEEGGLLSYTLFAPQSAFYTGDVIETRDYDRVNITNSFGHEEYRYRVKLAAKIGQKHYTVSFTLADRSWSRFPVLLGKSFLKNRFLVDVSQKNVVHDASGVEVSEKVVILTSRIDEQTKGFFRSVEELSAANIEVTKYRLLNYEIHDNGVPRISLPDGSDIATVQLVYFKAHALYPEYAGAIVKYLQTHKVNFIDKNVACFISRSKISEYFTLAAAGMPVPALKVLPDGLKGQEYENITEYFEEDQFVLKDAFSDQGKFNFFIKNKDSYNEAKERLAGRGSIVAQRFIPSEGFLRVLVMGDEIVQIVERTASGHQDALKEHLNKPRGSVNAIEHQDYDKGVLALACKAAKVMGRTVAGVDLIRNEKTNKWYVLEVNYNPELTSGYGVSQKAKGTARLLMKERKI